MICERVRESNATRYEQFDTSPETIELWHELQYKTLLLRQNPRKAEAQWRAKTIPMGKINSNYKSK